MDTVLLATKLRIPPQPHHAVRRDRLIDALERAIPQYRLVLISAPAGYGKTTLLAQWAHASRLPVAWLSVGEEDNDVERFFRYLLACGGDLSSPAPVDAALPEPLTTREQDVLQLIAADLTNREIAGRLVIASETVKKHVANICDKLGVRNRTEAAARARELDLLA